MGNKSSSSSSSDSSSGTSPVIDELDANTIVEEFYKNFLHGELVIQIVKAEGLINTDHGVKSYGLESIGSCIPIERAFSFSKNLSDPFVAIYLGESCLCQTSWIPDKLNPTWNEKFSVPVCHNEKNLKVIIKDKDAYKVGGDDIVASTSIPVFEIIKYGEVSGWFQLNKNSKQFKINSDNLDGTNTDAQISLHISYKPKYELAYRHGDGRMFLAQINENDLNYSKQIENAYLPTRYDNASLILYQAASNCPGEIIAVPGVIDTLVDRVKIDSVCVHENWRKDLYESIKRSEKFIYLSIPSLNPKMCLFLNGGDENKSLTIGELLSEKRNEGVKVVILIWDHDKREASGMTPSTDTIDYFTSKNIPCIANQRIAVDRNERNDIKHCHSQRFSVMDEPMSNENEERDPFAPKQSMLVSYVGIELENNRNETSYDCRGYNCGISKFKGLPSMDVKRNFEERWQKLSNNKDIIMPDLHLSRTCEEFENKVEDPSHHNWTIQVLRSIDSDGCHFSNVDRRRFLNVSKQGQLVDDTIYRSLIWQIRNAKRFIYLECPKFVGSAYAWHMLDDNETMDILKDTKENIVNRDNNIIPKEITERIIDTILLRKDDFKVYIVLQDIDSINKKTIEKQHYKHRFLLTVDMMYRKIAKALMETKIQGRDPNDYLMFFRSPDCIKSVDKNVRTNIAIFDDEYAMVGCLNGGIGNDYLSGVGDTELGIGVFQPYHNTETRLVFDTDRDWKTIGEVLDTPQGDVHKYRMSRWCTLFGEYPCPPEFKDPGSRKCLAKVRSMCNNVSMSGNTSPNSSRSSSVSSNSDAPKYMNSSWNKGDTCIAPYPIEILEDGRCRWKA